MHILYSLLLTLLVLISLPWWMFQMVRSGKYRRGLSERLGRVPARLPSPEPQGAIWIHAVSVGEVLAITGLVGELREKSPDHPVFVSTTTLTEQYLARLRLRDANAFLLPT